MQIAFPNQANILTLPLVAIADGSKITAGTVNFYLLAMSGTNVGKWWKLADGLWYAAEQLAGTGTHKARGHWQISIAEGAWTDEVMYLLYAEEDSGLSIAVETQVWCNTLEQMQKADRYIQTGDTPWTIDYKHKDTGAILLTQTMKNTDGENITSKNNILGRLEKE